MYQISRLMWFMSRGRPLIQVPYGLKVIGYGAVADTFIKEDIGPGLVMAAPGLPVAGTMAHGAMHGTGDAGGNTVGSFQYAVSR
jgi:hypothetical protein